MLKLTVIIPSPMRTDLYRQAYPAGDYTQLDNPEENTSIYIESNEQWKQLSFRSRARKLRINFSSKIPLTHPQLIL